MAAVEIDDRDLTGIGHIDESSPRPRLDLKALGMRRKRHSADHGAALGINDRQATLAVADDHIAACRIDADIVRIILQIDASDRAEIGTPEHPHGPVAGVRHEHQIRSFSVGNALRLREAHDALHAFARREMDHLDGVIAKRRHDEALALLIERHVIDPAGYLVQRDRRGEHQVSGSLGHSTSLRQQRDASDEKCQRRR